VKTNPDSQANSRPYKELARDCTHSEKAVEELLTQVIRGQLELAQLDGRAGGTPVEVQDLLVSPDLQHNKERMREILGGSPDLIYREFTCGQDGVRAGLMVYINSLSEGKSVEDLLRSFTTYTNPPFVHPDTSPDPIVEFKDTVTVARDLQVSRKLDDAVDGVMTGQVAAFLHGSTHVLVVDTRWNPGRAPEEPAVEAEVRGPRDGFVENIRLNATLVRRRVRDPRLQLTQIKVGKRSKTDVAVMYIKGLADDGVVAEVERRIRSIEIDNVLESGYLAELINDHPWSPFSIILNTERPDRFTAALYEGRVGILQDNTPFALVVPTTFWQLLQAPGDYYVNYWIGTALRWVRFLALFIAVTSPAIYILLTTFHHEMLPTPLALSVAAGREGTPLPTLVEVLAMLVMFEAIHEAGLRLPRAVGQTVSIVGALVIGDAAVSAGLVAPSTVIVIATAGITGFAIPVYSVSLLARFIRLPLMLITGALGLFGFLGSIFVIWMHLSSLRSFGTPYLGPVAPLQMPEQRDVFIRAPWGVMGRRPRFGRERRTVRQQTPPGISTSRSSTREGTDKR